MYEVFEALYGMQLKLSKKGGGSCWLYLVTKNKKPVAELKLTFMEIQYCHLHVKQHL